MFATTPEPPYIAVIFTALRSDAHDEAYAVAAVEMETMASAQPGYLGVESARDAGTRLGITVSYWRTEADATAWKAVTEHLVAQEAGRSRWYTHYEVRVATVTRAYGFEVDGG